MRGAIKAKLDVAPPRQIAGNTSKPIELDHPDRIDPLARDGKCRRPMPY
jgi:hypothetical protein